MKNKSLDFVAKYYKHGALDVKSSYRKSVQRAGAGLVPAHKNVPTILKSVKHILGPVQDRPLQVAVAAVVAFLLIGGAILFFRQPVTTLASADTNKVFTLEDGTVVTLAPHSTLSYRGDCREVELTGKANLNIHHDASHPFMIKDDNYTIRDVGTRLLVEEIPPQPSIKREGASVTVYVEEGSVALSTPNNSASEIVLKKSQGATVVGKGQIKRLANASQNLTAWATHEFHFDNTPLPEVLHDLSDYYHVRLTCKSSEDKRLTADFQADSLQNIIEMIEETMNVRIEK